MSDFRIVRREKIDGSVWFVIQKQIGAYLFSPTLLNWSRLVPTEPRWVDYVYCEKHPWKTVDIACQFDSQEKAEAFLKRLTNPKEDEVVFLANRPRERSRD